MLKTILAILLFWHANAQATLFDRGGGLIYDNALNVTWLANANYAQPPGGMEWSDAVHWASNLTYSGYTDWRLPTTPKIDTTCDTQLNGYSGQQNVSWGFGCTGSEMGHLFYSDFGGTGLQDPSSLGPVAAEFRQLFLSNLSFGVYWSGTPFAPQPDFSWYFALNPLYMPGLTGVMSQVGEALSALAVRDGDSTYTAPPPNVPEPSSAILVGLGLVVLFRYRSAFIPHCP